MTPKDLTDNLKSHLPTIASWAGRLGFGGILAYSLSPLWNMPTNEAALAAMAGIGTQLIPNLLSEGITRIYDMLRSGGKKPTPEELAQAIEDEAVSSPEFRDAMLDYTQKLLNLNRHIFREVQMTHESVVEMWDRLGEELKRLGAAETESAKKIEGMRDEVLAGLTRVETKVDSVKDDTQAMRLLVEEIYSRPTAVTNNVAGDQLNAAHDINISINGQPVTRLFFGVPRLPRHKVVGRATLVAQLRHHLISSGPVAVTALSGKPGVGKSALATLLAYDGALLDHFSGGVLWARLGPEPSLDDIIINWAAALGLDLTSIPDMDTRIARLSDTLANRRCLIVLDDEREVQKATRRRGLDS